MHRDSTTIGRIYMDFLVQGDPHMYLNLYVSLCICMYVCLFVCMFVCLYVCMYVRTYVCMIMYVCMIVYVCIYIYLHIKHVSNTVPIYGRWESFGNHKSIFMPLDRMNLWQTNRRIKSRNAPSGIWTATTFPNWQTNCLGWGCLGWGSMSLFSAGIRRSTGKWKFTNSIPRH